MLLIVWHGLNADSSLVRYPFICFVINNEEKKAQEIKKVISHMKAFFTDLYCLTVVGGSAAILVPFVYIISINDPAFSLNKIDLAFKTFSISFMWAHRTGAFSPSYTLSTLLAYKELRVGMFLALEMRNQMGLVNEREGLLPFSCEDKFDTKINLQYQDEKGCNVITKIPLHLLDGYFFLLNKG